MITLNHLVKERYPRFIDALRDLDDPLCMVHLFANLPTQGRITPEHVKTCSTLCKEWQQFIMQSQALRKVFVSVKGIYYQVLPIHYVCTIPIALKHYLYVMLTGRGNG